MSEWIELMESEGYGEYFSSLVRVRELYNERMGLDDATFDSTVRESLYIGMDPDDFFQSLIGKLTQNESVIKNVLLG